jgi:hypothetical protein
VKKTEAAQRLSLCWSLTHLSDCPKEITKTRWSGASCAACAAHWLLTEATFSSDAGSHLLAVARNKYINAYFNEKAAHWLEEHPDLDTWTQADLDRMVERWTGEASTLWDNPPTPGQPT